MAVDILFSTISGIVSGIIAAILTNWYYWSKKPRIKISDKIAVNNENEYHLKIINKSKFYITNIYIQLQLITVSNGDGGTILHLYDLKFPCEKIKIISPYSKEDKDASYAIRLGISKNLDQVWEEDEHTYLKFIIYCSNERNNSSKLFEQIYYKKKCIKHGNFMFGDSLEIIEE